MFNKQLKKNIDDLDLQISKIGKEFEVLQKDSKYETKMRTLEDLTKLRAQLIQGKVDEKSDAVMEIDRQIEELAMVIQHLETDNDYVSKLQRLEDLTKLRVQLAECRAKESNAPAIISGVVGLAGIALVLNYEKTDIITSKAFGIATKLFRGV